MKRARLTRPAAAEASLPLADYRRLVALDRPFATPPAARDDEEVAALVRRVVEYLEADPAVARLALSGRADTRDDVAEPRLRLRALLAVRSAKPLPENVHAWIDAILQAGFNTPGVVRLPLERLAVRHQNTRFVRINRDYPEVPRELRNRAIALDDDAGTVLLALRR